MGGRRSEEIRGNWIHLGEEVGRNKGQLDSFGGKEVGRTKG